MGKSIERSAKYYLLEAAAAQEQLKGETDFQAIMSRSMYIQNSALISIAINLMRSNEDISFSVKETK